MYYVLFNHTKGSRDFVKFRTDGDVVDFLHSRYKKIEVIEIIEVRAAYRLGLVVTEDFVNSTLEPAEEKDVAPVGAAIIQGKSPEEIIKENKGKLEELETEEPSGEETEEEELTDEEKTGKFLDEADQIIAREKKRQEQKKKGWELCTECNSSRVAPWNKKKVYSGCQNKKKTDQPYSRSKEFPGI